MDTIKSIIIAMQDDLTTEQLQKLERVLILHFSKADAGEREDLAVSTDGWATVLNLFLATKRLANCAESTIAQYNRALRTMFATINKPLRDITTNDLRYYMALYQERRKVSAGYLDTLRLYFSSFFGWCCLEGLLPANPAARLTKIKIPKTIKHPYTSEEMSKLRDHAHSFRDRALIEIMYATGCRIGEICALDIKDVDVRAREIKVWGEKGKAERMVYITDEAIYHLRKYLMSRTDDSPALFVNLRAPHARITKSGVESMLHKLGAECGIHCHPHKFRRTMLTEGARRGMPIQDLQRLAGHVKIDTTMMYVSVSDASVKANYDRYIA